MRTFQFLIVSLLVVLAAGSCKKSYTIGGSLFNPNVNMTTYDYLKTNHLFDTLVMMIDGAGLKNEVNQAGTFFAVTNFSIRKYLLTKQAYLQVVENNENLLYTFDSLNLPALRDTLRTYMFHDRLTRDNIGSHGAWRATNEGDMRWVQLLATTDYTNQNIFTTSPQYIYLTKVLPPLPADSTGLQTLPTIQLLPALCQTTGILTTTGVLHVVNNNHTFNYYGGNN